VTDNADGAAEIDAERRLARAFYEETVRQRDSAWREIVRLRTALHDAIARPMGVVPDSALEFYRPGLAAAAAGTPTRDVPTYGELVDTVADLVHQFAYTRGDGSLIDGGLSTLEGAFHLLERLGVLHEQPNGGARIDHDAVAALAGTR
jgi:hypothetical protein